MSPGVKVALVPGVLALLPAYAGRVDPVAELRAAAQAAVQWLGPDVQVVADAQGMRVAEALGVSSGLYDARRRGSWLLDQRSGGFETVVSATSSTSVGGTNVLVVANGSARRSEKAPGHLDERAQGFDADVEKALRCGDVEALRGIDRALARELMVCNIDGLADLGKVLPPGLTAEVDYADDPFGVQYWVMRWSADRP
ncbi:hypothetical protein BKA08_001833 [Nocardioides marinisabuli]|uniref:Uncharacterized protein n=1 Tax=Nocardioides marinisabuli TaxID=419476 RepID=A0A7Y9JQN2_9ACTN|nr:hypothetical protein [Nocardioides marinisabuli]